jgi:hypothetical protein
LRNGQYGPIPFDHLPAPWYCWSMENCKVVCPKCHRYWADLKYGFRRNGDLIPSKPADLKIVAGNRKRLNKGDSMSCSLCGHGITNFDVYLSIAHGMNNSYKELEPGESPEI